MMKNAGMFKKFQFLDIMEGGVKPSQESFQSNVQYDLNNISIQQMRTIDNTVFVTGKVFTPKDQSKSTHELLVKIYQSKPTDDYDLFDTQILNFDVIEKDSSRYAFVIGIDSKPDPTCPEISPETRPFPLSCLKIFDITAVTGKDNESKPKYINGCNLLTHKHSSNLTLSKNVDANNNTSITDIHCFKVSNDLTTAIVAIPNGKVHLIMGTPNLVAKDCKIDTALLETKCDSDITNVGFTYHKNNLHVIFTNKDTFYTFNMSNAFGKTINSYTPVELDTFCGVDKGCFALHPKHNQFLYVTPGDNFIKEFTNFEMGPIWCFDGAKKFVLYFKNYILFVVYEERVSSLAVYDNTNQIFIYYTNAFSNITSISVDDETIFVLDRNETTKTQRILRFREKDNKEKFDTFYKKSFYDTAFTYAKNLGYDPKKISEISRRHAEYLFKKNEPEKAIEQYIKTINFLDPAYVIQKFLDGSKLDVLISYLDALNKDVTFRKNTPPEEMKDYTALLLNCYIKQKKIKELEKFVEQKDILEQPKVLETAIEVCKNTKHIDLALRIAAKGEMKDAQIQILMDIQKKYTDALKLIESEKDKIKKFEMFMKYGARLLEKEQKKTMDLLIPLIRTLIQIKNGNPSEDYNPDELEQLKTLKYEQIVSIFSDEINSPIEDLLNIIMEDDQQCPPLIFHRQIELFLDKLKKSPEDNFKIGDSIKNLLRNEKYQKIMDLNYLMLLFKIYGFQNGVVELNEILELKQELMQLYMDNHNYDKLVSLCNSYGQSDMNYWVQALNYFLGISTNTTKGLLEKYIKQTLDNLFQSESVSPLVLLEIINKSKERSIPFETIKDVLLRFLSKTKESLTEDQRECEGNMQKIEKLEQEKQELQTKAKTYNFLKCSLCNGQITPPFIYFMCNHAIHSHCFDGSGSNEDLVCPLCRMKRNQLEQRISQAKEMANDHNSFFMDLKGTGKKFDLYGKYLGKGVFDLDDEADN